jgi:hypothetical protein
MRSLVTEKVMETAIFSKAVRRQRHLESGADFPKTSPTGAEGCSFGLGKRAVGEPRPAWRVGSDRRARRRQRRWRSRTRRGTHKG